MAKSFFKVNLEYFEVRKILLLGFFNKREMIVFIEIDIWVGSYKKERKKGNR